MYRRLALSWFLGSVLLIESAHAYHLGGKQQQSSSWAAAAPPTASLSSRREWIEAVARSKVAPVVGAGILLGTNPFPAVAADTTTSTTTTAKPNGLAYRLSLKDPDKLQNRLFNAPPAAQVYPEFMRGTWKMKASFNGFLFPSKTIPRDKLTKNVLVPGFQKCSIAGVADVGTSAAYTWSVDAATGLADITANLESQIDAYLGYKAVASVDYKASKNPNRVSVDFVDYKTINAERIELFCNARESELVVGGDKTVFVCSEYVRQVTFGTGQDVGVPRQVVTNYAHFWTWKPVADGSIQGNLLTAAYLDPQDPMYFDEPSKPVAVYSHSLTGERV